MSSTRVPPPTDPEVPRITFGLTMLLATACGLLVANIYWAQPLVGPIARDLGLTPAAAGLIVTLTQIGYGLGLLFLVPLGDLVENRRLIVTMVALLAATLVGAAFANGATTFLVAALLIGLGSVAVQMIVPFAAHLAPAERRGRVVGNVTTGLMLGIMLARPVSSAVTAISSWHVIYFAAAVAMVFLAIVLRLRLPTRRPGKTVHYFELLASMVGLARRTPALRRRAFYQACLFFAFSLFWTVTPLVLAGPDFGLTQRGIALFALAGVSGAIAAPLAGHAADRGHGRIATVAAMLLTVLAFGLTHLAVPGSSLAIGLLTAAAIVLDFGVQTNLIVGYRFLFELGPDLRSRINGLYMATFFTAGALGSATGVWAHTHGGWPFASALGMAAPLAGLVGFVLAEPRRDGADA